MVRCPRCQCNNPDQACACGRCSHALLGPPVHLAAPLPEPKTEPVSVPVMVTAADERPLSNRPALARPFEVDEDAIPAAASPRWVTARDPNATHGPTVSTLHVSVTNGPQIARLVPPDHPMNDSVAQAGNATVPATDPADQAPTAPPPHGLRPKLVVLRGMKINAEYPIYEGRNTLGRFADKPVDIDLVSQESAEQIWCSRQHAAVLFEKGSVLIEDLNSLNGTWVNGIRIHAGQTKPLRPGDVVQVGTVQMKLVMG